MKFHKVLLPTFCLFLFSYLSYAQSTTIRPGSILPQISTLQRTSLLNPENGMLVFDTQTNSYWYRRNGLWTELSTSGSLWQVNGLNGNEIKNTNSGGFWSSHSEPVTSSIGNTPVAPSEGDGTRLMWIPSRSAFRAGTVAAKSKAWDKDSIGVWSTAFGFNSKALGHYSTSMGVGTAARGDRSIALGFTSVATGERSVSIGNNAKATGPDAISVGHSTIAGGYASLATGISTSASGNFTFTAGSLTSASGDYASAMGSGSKAWADYSSAFGLETNATGEISTAFGDNTLARAVGSFSIGRYNTESNPLPNLAQDTDKLFEVGNGLSVLERSNALTLLRNGNLTIAGTLTQNSDRRLKTEINPLYGSLGKINRLNGYTYFWTGENRDKNLQTGLIAQEVQENFPELVSADTQELLSVNYVGLIPHLIEAIKELKAEKDLLQLQIERMSEKLETLSNIQSNHSK